MRFHAPTKIVFGSGVFSQLKGIVEDELRASCLFLVTDRGIVDSGIAGKVLSQVGNIQVFDEIEQNPKHTTVNKAGGLVRKIKPNLVIGLGGGSPMDAAKAIALLATNPGNIEDYEGKEKYKSPPLPVLAIPTTCGTASEVTWVSVITHAERKFKMSIKGPHMFPAAALIDPDLLVSLPSGLIASTSLDALTHAVEAYTVKARTSITDIFAREALQLIFRYIEDANKDIKGNKEAREKMMLGSTIAGMAFCNSDVGAVHCVAEAVGGLYDVPHGVANSIFLPFVMEFNLPEVSDRYAEIARLAGIEEDDDKKAARELIERVKSLSRSLNIPSFKELGIKEGEFFEIAQKSFENNSNPSNPRVANVEDYLIILERAFQEI
ncbi:MAG: iron-containing alcohol dehydrogenase [Candidatus Aminicenantes bacterium]|nr:MAG: iron-containing alcohol dehydrogenase [Candidatus Aminicenantes bacterium]